MTRGGVLVGLVVLGVALSGCANQGPPASRGADAAAASQLPTTPTEDPAVPAPAPTATSEPDVFTPVDPVDYTTALSYARGGGVDFDSPSRMLHCGILDYGDPGDDLKWGCTVPEHSWQVPNSSPGDFCYQPPIPCGNGIEATGAQLPEPQMRSDVEFAGEYPQLPDQPDGYVVRALPYGSSITFAEVTCESAGTGLTCRHAVSGHGFTLSDSVYEAW